MDSGSFFFTGGAPDAAVVSALLADAATLTAFSRELADAAVLAVKGFLLNPEVCKSRSLLCTNGGSTEWWMQVDLLAAGDEIAARFVAKTRPFRGALRTLVLLWQGSVRHGLSPQHFSEDLVRLGVRGEAADVFNEAWRRDGPALITAQLSRASVPRCAILDASWRFGVTIATDDVQSAGATYVQLRLHIAAPDSAGRDERIELSLPQFYSMLSALERAKSYAAFLSGGDDAAAT